MSSFTDWNGPGGHCGPTLPQIKTLEELLTQLLNTQAELTTVHNLFNTHNAATAGIASNIVHITAAERTNWNAVITSLASHVNLISGAISHITTAERTQWNNAITTANNALTTANNAATQSALTLHTGNAAIHITSAQVAAITAATSAIAALTTNITTGTLTVPRIRAATTAASIQIDNLIRALQGIIAELYPDGIIDYRNFRYVVPYRRGVAGGATAYATYLIAVLSDVWDATPANSANAAPTAADQLHKSGRAYIKYVNSTPWNAIIDATATKIPAPVEYAGSLNGIVSKAASRGPIRFGLYHGTGSDGKEHIYLGVDPGDDITGIRVGLVDMLPLVATLQPTGNVTEIKSILFQESSIPVIDKLITDLIVDSEGHDIVRVNIVDNTIAAGNTTDALTILSADRPQVEVGDAQYQMAFLQDLAQSIYWQRNVDLIVDTPADLTDASKTTIYYDVNGNAVARDSPNIDPTKTVPGIYLVDPAAEMSTIPVHPFANGETALVKATGTTSPVADGYYNGTLVMGGSNVNQPGAVSGAPVQVGLILVDETGAYGRISSITVGSGVFGTMSVAAPYAFKQPGYYTFNGTAWVGPTLIPIPTVSPGPHMYDVSYEWAGPAAEQSREPADGYYYETAYAIWTAAHEQTTGPGTEWSVFSINMAGYRSVERQNEIDNYLMTVAGAQSDFGEEEQVFPLAIPEHALTLVPNPAYIHNRPWLGTSVLDGGSFDTPPSFAHWFVDGGDFTDFNGTVSAVSPIAANQEQFRNTIMRIWHGNFEDMPEIATATGTIGGFPDPQTAPLSIRTNFTRTLRWVEQDNVHPSTDPNYAPNSLWYSDGLDLHQLIPPAITYNNIVQWNVCYAMCMDPAQGLVATRALLDQTVIDLGNEVTRATAAEGVIAADLITETNRATAAEGVIAADLITETNRATAAEGVIAADLITETNRATAAESVLTTDLSNEVTRANTAEGVLNTAVTAAQADATQGIIDAATALSYATNVNTNLSSEITRATNAEGALNAAVTTAQIDATQGIADAAAALTYAQNVNSNVGALNTRLGTAESNISTLTTAVGNVTGTGPVTLDMNAAASGTNIIDANGAAHGELGWVLANPPSVAPPSGNWVIGYDDINSLYHWTF